MFCWLMAHSTKAYRITCASLNLRRYYGIAFETQRNLAAIQLWLPRRRVCQLTPAADMRCAAHKLTFDPERKQAAGWAIRFADLDIIA